MIIDGRKIRNEILEEVKTRVLTLPFTPIFCDILVGDDKVSASYVALKEKTAISVGIKVKSAKFIESITTEELIQEIENLNKVPHMCGIIVQLPLPLHINQEQVLNAIRPELDVDCLGKNISDKFYNNESNIGFPAALACIKMIDSLGQDLRGKNIVVLGQGKLVGKPVTHILRSRGLEVSTIDRSSQNSLELIKNADILVSGIGSPAFVKKDMLKEGVIVIDAGTSEENGGVVGDVDKDVASVASFVSLTPGGVGPVTVAILLENVLTNASHIYEQ